MDMPKRFVSPKQVYYDYKNYWRRMMRKFSCGAICIAFFPHFDGKWALLVGNNYPNDINPLRYRMTKGITNVFKSIK